MFFIKAVFIFITAYSAFVYRKPDIIRMDFCDVINNTPRLHDGRLLDTSLNYTCLNYLVNEKDPKYFTDSVLENYIKSDSFILDQIKKKYYEFTVSFYQKSENTDALMKVRSSKYLSDCNDDLIAEFQWRLGKFEIEWHFKNGRMLEAENIVLEDLNPNHSNRNNTDTTYDGEKGFILYKKVSDTLNQTLNIKYISGSGISFELKTVNKKTKEQTSLSGNAYAKTGQDPETDEDEDGDSYASTVYHYKKGNCNLSIRIALKHHDKAVIMEYYCNKLHPAACPFGTVGTLQRVSE